LGFLHGVVTMSIINTAVVCPRHAALCALLLTLPLASSLACASAAATISGRPATSVIAKHKYEFKPSVRDSNHGKLTFGITNKPRWAAFDSSTGLLAGTPLHAATFKHIVICVRDKATRRCLPAFAVKVLPPVDTPPVLSGTPAATATVGSAYSFQPRGHDPSGLRLTFQAWNKPSWLKFDRATGRLYGTPTAADVGKYAHIDIGASNGHVETDLRSFSITVRSLGSQLPPSAVTIEWSPPTENTNGSALTDLAGYHLYYGTTQSDLTKVVDITNPGLASYVLSDLTAGTWYFALTSVNTAGVESMRSTVISTLVE
jgi:hypothetical protein